MQVSNSERQRVGELPDLMDRINALGVTEEYTAYRSRFRYWHQGSTVGSKGELGVGHTKTGKSGFGYWYPTMTAWKWRRTLSYWIAVSFFEGSLFFTMSCFLGCFPDRLGRLKFAVTTCGLVGGKLNFFLCTYLMCLETINLSNADHQHSSCNLDTVEDGKRNAEEPFMFWPFHGRTAVKKLKLLGAGPWPYCASVIYFLGVLVFGIGLAAEFVMVLPQLVSEWIVLISFTVGSIMFSLGGLFECLENKVFTTCVWDQGYVGALLNFVGGLGFTVGSVLAFLPDQAFASNFSYGVASALFALGSATMIIMWKDEQYGLTFLAVLNHLGDPDGSPTMAGESKDQPKTLSKTAAFFIMVYVMAAVASFYDFLITFANVHDLPLSLVFEGAFNALLPCIFAHLMLTLNSGIYRTPKVAPFHSLYIACRGIAGLTMLNNLARVVQEIAAQMSAPVGN